MTTANTNEPATARSIGSVTIGFGLISIPCKVYTTEQKADEIHFNMLHDADSGRLKQNYTCTTCNEQVDREHTVKGYEHAKGQYVVFTKEELETIDAVASNRIELDGYVTEDSIDPLFVEKTYYLGPDKGHDKTYVLFATALHNREVCGVGRWSTRGKEHVVVVVPFLDGLAIHQLRYAREVKPWSAVPARADVRLSNAEVAAAEQLVAACELPEIDLGKYEDRVHERITKLVETKVAGGELVAAPAEAPAGNIIDLMQALKASIDSAPKKSPRATPIKKAVKKTKAKALKRKRAA